MCTMTPGCPTQVAEKAKTEYGNLIRQVKAKADIMKRYQPESSGMCYENTRCANGIGCSRSTGASVEQPKGSEPFRQKPYYRCPICMILK
jgi:hypothetical protein